ncbi:hypothetical protein VARIO8X_120336 [Burkholderiales bacterium 8X]|nr:hypothetical protein VARIO8X_120336 [Burkholderiales bacterium 8X]
MAEEVVLALRLSIGIGRSGNQLIHPEQFARGKQMLSHHGYGRPIERPDLRLSTLRHDGKEALWLDVLIV